MAKSESKNTFSGPQLIFINNFIKSIIDTEDFSGFSKYTKNLVKECCANFLHKLASEIWRSFSEQSYDLENFFKSNEVSISKHLNRIKNLLLKKNILSDLMSDNEIRHKLEKFFIECENRSEFKKVQNGYLILKEDFHNIIALANSYYDCGLKITNNAEYLAKKYLEYKAEKYKEMGYDVVLEYYRIDNFNFIYRDSRLNDENERAKCDAVAIAAAIKKLMPGFTGDISDLYDVYKI